MARSTSNPSRKSSSNPPDSYYSVPELAEILGVSRTTIYRRIEKLRLRRFRDKNGHIYLTPNSAERLMQSFPGEVTHEWIPGWITTGEAVERYGFTKATFKWWIITGKVRGKRYRHLWIMDPRSVEEYIAKRNTAPQGWVPVREVAKRTGRTTKSVIRLARANGWPLRKYRHDGYLVFHIRKSDARILESVDELVPVSKYLRERYGLSDRAIERVVKRLDGRIVRLAYRERFAKQEDIEEAYHATFGKAS